MIKKKKFINYYIGQKSLCSHIDAVHAKSPCSDQYTGKIATGVIKKINASGIISTISRLKKDINRPRNITNASAIDEYRETIREIIDTKKILNEFGKLNKNYLHIAIHGMKDEGNAVFEIGTCNDFSCSKEILNWFIMKLKKLNQNYKVNNIFSGDNSKSYHRNGDPSSGYEGYGDKFHTIQVEINKSWRKYKQKELIDFFSDVLIEFDKQFN